MHADSIVVLKTKPYRPFNHEQASISVYLYKKTDENSLKKNKGIIRIGRFVLIIFLLFNIKIGERESIWTILIIDMQALCSIV